MGAAWVTAAAALVAVAVPAAAAGGGLRVPAALALLGALATGSAGAGAVLLGFGAFLVGLTRVLVAARCPAPAAAGLASLLGCALLVLPFLGDPLVEPRGPGKESRAGIAALVGGSPLAAAVGGGLGVDLLRTPRAYGSSGGGLSRIGAYYSYSYPRPAAAGAAWAAAGLLLAAGAGLARRRAGP